MQKKKIPHNSANAFRQQNVKKYATLANLADTHFSKKKTPQTDDLGWQENFFFARVAGKLIDVSPNAGCHLQNKLHAVPSAGAVYWHRDRESGYGWPVQI